MKEFELPRIPALRASKQKEGVGTRLSDGRPSKMNFHFSYELIEQIKDYAYWEGLTQQEVVREAVELFLKSKEIRSRPETVKNRPRPGRKPKGGA